MQKILVVDDDPNNRLLLASVLNYGGYAVLEAADGIDGLRFAREHLPDLAIIDLHMPRLSGTAFIKELRADLAIAQMKVALYTRTRIDAAMEMFIDLYRIAGVIPKPLEPDQLLALVASMLGAAVEE